MSVLALRGSVRMDDQLQLFGPLESEVTAAARRAGLCDDCAVNTIEIGEGYMVVYEVWSEAHPEGRGLCGLLCIGCLERRLGRRLVPSDFTDVPLNRSAWQSPRLRGRRGRGPRDRDRQPTQRGDDSDY
jgi:hypothetical protein